MDRTYLRAATRQASEAKRTILLQSDNIDSLIQEEHERTRIPQNIDKLLQFIALRCPRPGQVVIIEASQDYPVIDAFGEAELMYIINAADERGFIRKNGSQYWLTPAGWASLSASDGAPIPGRCFVAMSFNPHLNEAFQDGIRAAVEDDCGLSAVRMMELEHNDKICDRIIVEIRRAQFVIADFTFQRGGVYYEAGFASALGRPVIWTCKHCHFKRLHFDTRQYNHIKWESATDLRSQLAARIRGTIPGARLMGR